jgi:hypothetical protein
MSAGERAITRLLIGGAMAAVMTIGTLAAPAHAGSAGWESILGGHLKSKAAATKIPNQARAKGFKVYVQKISSTNWELEIFNGGGSKSQALAVCARANKLGLPHCSVEQEFHGNGWSKGGS